MWYDTLRFGIDWINVTVDCSSIVRFVEEVCSACNLDVTAFRPLGKNGQHFYTNAISYTLCDGFSDIVFSYCLLDDGSVPVDTSIVAQHGIFCSISGNGCRYLESVQSGNLRRFCDVVSKYHHKCTRLDICMDILDKDNPIVPLFTQFSRVAYNPQKGDIAIKSNMVRSSGYVTWNPVYDEDIRDYTDNVTIGKRTSVSQCQCYNKKVQVKNKYSKELAEKQLNSVGATDYWYRIEYRAKEKFAQGCFQLACSGVMAQDIFYYMADEFITFVSLDYGFENISKCSINVVWDEFLVWLKENAQNVHFVELTSAPYVPHSVTRTMTWMKRNASFIVSLARIKEKYPDFFDHCVAQGLAKRELSGKYFNFDFEIENTIESNIFMR